jgi:hypothetical protein
MSRVSGTSALLGHRQLAVVRGKPASRSAERMMRGDDPQRG